MKQNIIELKGQVFDLNVIRSSALCLRTERILTTRCDTADESYVIESSSGYNARIAFNGRIRLFKNNTPVAPVFHEADSTAKPISLVECLLKMTKSALHTHQQKNALANVADNTLRTTVLSKAILNLARGQSDIIAVQSTELSVMDQLLVEALSKTHDVRFTNDSSTSIVISKSCHSHNFVKHADIPCQITQMHS